MDNLDNYYTAKESFLVVLDSRNATTYNNGTKHSDITLDLEDVIRMPKNCIVMSVVVNSFTCPISFYQINSTNKIFIFNNISYSIPLGNYNASTFSSAIASLIPSLTLTINTTNNVFTLSNNGVLFTINIGSTVGTVMGFNSSSVYTSSSGGILVLPYPCNFSGLNSLNILCENLMTKNIHSYSKTTSPILASVPVNGTGVIYYEKRNDFNTPIRNDIIDSFDIMIQDDLNNYIDFNNQHWNLVLQFDVIFDKPRFSLNFNEILELAYQ